MNVPLSSENAPNDIACENSEQESVCHGHSVCFDIAVLRIFRRFRSARRRQLTFDGLRIMRETLGDAARHVADIEVFFA
jgi:hypothetical protein